MKNKTLIILLSVLALIISYTANSQFIYASGQYSYTQQYSNVGIHVGLQYTARSLGHYATYDLILPEVKKWQ